MDEIIVSLDKTCGYPYPVCKIVHVRSYIPDKDIHVFYLDGQFLSHPCYLTRSRIKITCIKCIGCIGSHVSSSSSDVGFLQPLRQKMTSLYAN